MNKSTIFKNRVFESEDDASLVARARQDPEAFGLLYERYVIRIYRYLFSLVREAEGAEELTAKVFTAAWEGLHRYRERGEFAAWLFRIARNKANDFHRQRRKPQSLESIKERISSDQQTVWDPSIGLEYAEDLERLAGLVQRLNANQVELLRLRFAAELTYAEIASLSGSSEGAVKMAVHRLLRQLKAEWETRDE